VPLAIARSFQVVDSHTAGHPTRAILGGLPPLAGASVRERRDDFRGRYDWLRPMLLHEPRGHAAMVGAVLTHSATADFGAFFISSYIYLDMCGHATIGLAKTLAATGQLDIAAGQRDFTLETPAGPVGVALEVGDDGASGVTIANVPSHVLERDLAIDVPDIGMVRLDIAYGGNRYAIVDAAAHGWPLRADDVSGICRRGGAIKAVVNRQSRDAPGSPADARIDSVLFYEDLAEGRARHLVVLEANKFDRSPCGTGTSARLALLHAQGRLDAGTEFVAEGILGTHFRCRIERTWMEGGRTQIAPRVTGNAHITAFSTLVVENGDPLAAGFLCR
jgi:proline racemase